MAASSKIIVIDDDPTGSQTVHSCPLLLRWDAATLAAGLRHSSPLLFLLANTRALAPEAAAERVRQICRALAAALPLAGIEEGRVIFDNLKKSIAYTLASKFPEQVGGQGVAAAGQCNVEEMWAMRPPHPHPHPPPPHTTTHTALPASGPSIIPC